MIRRDFLKALGSTTAVAAGLIPGIGAAFQNKIAEVSGGIPAPVKLEGYSYRWVRYLWRDTGEYDMKNIADKVTAGWRPVRRDSSHESEQLQFAHDELFGDAAAHGDLLLMVKPSVTDRDGYVSTTYEIGDSQDERIDRMLTRGMKRL